MIPYMTNRTPTTKKGYDAEMQSLVGARRHCQDEEDVEFQAPDLKAWK
jgi:hypothetical protein